MLYLLDANVLITAKDSYYSFDSVPEFWDWLEYMGQQGLIKIPIEIWEEIKDGPTDKDPLYEWLQNESVKGALLFDEDVDPEKVQRVVVDGYADNLTDAEVEEIGRDAFLVAYALDIADRCVVTTEASKPSRKRQNRHVPDVCNSLGVKSCGPFELNRNLGFKTNWKK